MCGIAGIVCGSGDVDREAVIRMQNALRHRGPDGSGNYDSDYVSLAHTRLSII